MATESERAGLLAEHHHRINVTLRELDAIREAQTEGKRKAQTLHAEIAYMRGQNAALEECIRALEAVSSHGQKST